VVLAALCVGSSLCWDIGWKVPGYNLDNTIGGSQGRSKVVCFWNATSFQRTGLGKFQVEDLRPALSVCTHLIYGYAGINARNNEVVPLHPYLDTENGHGFYRLVTMFKNFFPSLKIYLSIGGYEDPSEKTHKYLKLTETPKARNNFISSISRLLNQYNFDGVDLAWQFPAVPPKKKTGLFGGFWKKDKILGYEDNFKDKKESTHRNGFTALVRDLQSSLRWRNKSVSITVLPHVSAKVYYDIRQLAPHIDAIHLMAFDQKTPQRNSKEADFPSPIYGSRGSMENIDSSVSYWLQNGAPAKKIIVGIPTFARTWKISTKKMKKAENPPVVAEGIGEMGLDTKIPGFLSYPEVCVRINRGTVKRVGDVSRNTGSYAYSLYNSKTEKLGTWIGFEEPFTAADKARYAKKKGLGGIAIFDLSTDDFRGSCGSDKFPILKGAVYNL